MVPGEADLSHPLLKGCRFEHSLTYLAPSTLWEGGGFSFVFNTIATQARQEHTLSFFDHTEYFICWPYARQRIMGGITHGYRG